jgi:hypothetical protein
MLPDGPGLTVVGDKPAGGNGQTPKKRARPAMHEAASEDDPHANGLEIR